MPKAIQFLFLIPILVAPLKAGDLYVSPLGDDGWTGALAAPNAASTDGPLRSPARAIEKSRDLRKALPQAPVRILLESGLYRLTAPLVLYVADSGLSLEAAPGASVTLSGGRPLTGWKKEGGLWSAQVGPGWTFRWLSADGSPRFRARLPREGFFTHETRFDVRWKSSTGGGWGRPLTQEETGQMTYREGDLGSWLDQGSAELEILHMWDESWVGIESLDPKARLLRFTGSTTHPPGAFDVRQYAVWNVKEGLTDPGQWCLDKAHGKVWYKPRAGEDPNRMDFEAPTLTTLIRLNGYKDLPVSAVTIQGLTLTLTDVALSNTGFGAMNSTAAIELTHVRDCRLAGLKVLDLAGWGLQSMDGDRNAVEGCGFSDLGGGAVRLTGGGNRLEDSVIRRIGGLYRGAIGVYWEGSGGVIAHNTVEDVPYDGMMCQAGGALIECNKIRRAMLQLHDGAAIYTGFCKAVTIRGNDVRDIPDTGGYGSSAYYLDEQAENDLVEDNLSVGVARPMQDHMAKNNTIRGNLFVVEGDGRLCFPRCNGFRVEDNVLWASGSWAFEAPEGGVTAWPDNLVYSGTGKVEWRKLADYNPVATQDWGSPDGSKREDPRFADPLHGDFTLRSGSPAAKKLGESWKTAGPRSAATP